MRATMIGIGSRGDAQPCVALGAALRAAGHEATVATHVRYRDLVVDHGLGFAPVAEGDLSRGSATERGARWTARDGKRLPDWIGWYQDAQSVAHRRLVDCIDATRGADVVVAPTWATLLGLQVAQIFDVPLIRVHFKPMLWADTSWGRTVVWQWARPFINQGRRAEGLSPMSWHEPFSAMDDRKVPLIAAYSPQVAPLDHGDWVTPTGYWSLRSQEDEALSPELEAFLADGPPPVLMTLAAMAEDLPSMLPLVADAFARAGQRGIVTHDRFDPAIHHLPDHLLGTTYAPHEQVFPRLAAVVHTGGAGTTGAAFRAGVPAVVVPYSADGPEWAGRVAKLGVGPEPIHRKKLTAENLGDAIRRAATDPEMRRRARDLADRLREEPGVDGAVALIEQHVRGTAGRVALARG